MKAPISAEHHHTVTAAPLPFALAPHPDRSIPLVMMRMIRGTLLSAFMLYAVSGAVVGDDAAAEWNGEGNDKPRVVQPFEDIVVYPDKSTVEIRAWTCLEQGFLEQIACSPGTREHESLVVVRVEPSNIHASMLLAGFESGRPGQWRFDPETERLQLIPPKGDKVDVFFRYTTEDGETVETSAREWIRDHHDHDREFPTDPWIFGGSMFKENPEWMGEGEHYVADMTGSIVGLVTFGDELIGLKRVISDRAAIHEPEWEIDTTRIPELGKVVTMIIRPYDPALYADEADDAGEAAVDDDADR